MAKDLWTKLNPELLTRTSYQDEKVESGRRYYYFLTAIDQTGNVSQPSEVVSEVVP
jgi:fibronectin type 3 domain-containing protein